MAKQAKQASCPRVDIGGQAVMEGVMMKSPDAIALAVRRPDHTIVVTRHEYVPLSKKHKWMGWPFIRGIINMGTMLSSGMKTLQESTEMLGILDEEPTKFEKWLAAKLGKGVDKIVMAVAIVLALALSIGLFMLLPGSVETFCTYTLGVPETVSSIIGGILKIALLIGYMLFCSLVPDVRRTFMYHGAEHKTVYCNEHGLPLTPDNAKQFTTLHPRCGTAFLLIVFVISLVLMVSLKSVLHVPNALLNTLVHLAMLPLVAGLSYEALKGMAHTDNKLTRIFRWPGMQLQRLTTREPDESMLECAIVAMNVALHGMPEDLPKTAEGYTVMQTYKDSYPEAYKGAEEA